ncbi:MAG: hypothetical protein WKF74_12255 [Pyrinomonadaceae bacterium]
MKKQLTDSFASPINFVCCVKMCIALGLLLLSGACSTPDNQNTTTNQSSTTNTSTPNTASSNTSTTTTTTKTQNTGGDQIGVAECDDYLRKYESCLSDKIPEAARASLRSSLDATRASWRSAAATPEGRAGLAQACRTARDVARQTMSAYGCQW